MPDNHSDPLGEIESPGWRVEVADELLSTNAAVAERAQRGEAAGLAVVADHQVAGRGRRGNRWEAPAGSALLLSVLLRPDAPMPLWPRLAIAAAVAVCHALEDTTPLAPRIKWPNDILADGGKIAGILIESRAADAHQPGWVVIGIGLNVHTRDFPLNLRYPATSIALACGHAPARATLARALLARLHAGTTAAFARWPDLLADYHLRDAAIGRRLQLDSPAGILSGTGAGLDAEGNLLLLCDGESRPRVLHDAHSLVFL
jgi:BirA family biotin operon repressor/biotin-[acetyl-CoA-carboxylase] ligase